jgi:hypothetical protein
LPQQQPTGLIGITYLLFLFEKTLQHHTWSHFIWTCIYVDLS